MHIPPNTMHSMKVLGGKEAHMLMIDSLGGHEKHLAREEAYTLKQRKDLKIRAQLR